MMWIASLIPALIFAGPSVHRVARHLAGDASTVLEWASLPSESVDSADKLIKLGVEQDVLVARTRIDATQGAKRVYAPGIGGMVRISATFVQGEAPDNVGRNFVLQRTMLADEEGAASILSISAVAGRLIVAEDRERDGSFNMSVQLVEDPPPGDLETANNAEDPVKLFVTRNDATDEHRNLNIRISAKSFAQLRAQYPTELGTYFRPIVRELHQEAAVFAVPPAVAWQVLGKGTAPDESVVRRVNALLPQLDADDFRQRERAMKALRALGSSAVAVVNTLDRSKLSAQQCGALDALLADAAPLEAANTDALASDPDFLLDVLFTDDPQLRAAALKKLSAVSPVPIPAESEFATDRREAIIFRLREELAARRRDDRVPDFSSPQGKPKKAADNLDK